MTELKYKDYITLLIKMDKVEKSELMSDPQLTPYNREEISNNISELFHDYDYDFISLLYLKKRIDEVNLDHKLNLIIEWSLLLNNENTEPVIQDGKKQISFRYNMIDSVGSRIKTLDIHTFEIYLAKSYSYKINEIKNKFSFINVLLFKKSFLDYFKDLFNDEKNKKLLPLFNQMEIDIKQIKNIKEGHY